MQRPRPLLGHRVGRACVFVCVTSTACGVGVAGCAHDAAEGRPWVHHLTLAGVHHVDKKDLLRKIAVQQTSWIPLAPKRYLDPFDLTLDKRRIESYYHAHGYFRARVRSVDVKPRHARTIEAAKSVDVLIDVDEGPVTRVEDVTLTGLDALGADASSIAAAGEVKVGDAFDSDRFAAWTDGITQRLKDRGHAWATVDGAVEVDRDRGAARVRVTVVAGPLVHVGRITTVGYFGNLSRAQLLLHAGLSPGALWTPEALDTARGKLYNLGIFSSVKIDFVPIPVAPSSPTAGLGSGGDKLADTTEVRLTLHEGPLRELRLGVGAGIEFQRNEVRLKGSYTRRNFLGGLRTLRVSLEPSYVVIPAVWDAQRNGPGGTAEIQFTQPDLFLPLDELKITAGYDLGIDYAYQYHGPRGQLAWSRSFLRDRLQLSLSYNFQYLLFFDTDPTILANPAEAQRLFGYTDPYRLGWLQEDLVLDLRNHLLDGRKGVYLGLTAEEGGVYTGSAFAYEKLLPQVRGFVPLGARVVVAARVEFGQVFVQGDLGSPITRRFYLGGPDSHRGFNYDRLSPQVPSGLAGVPSLPIGGDEMILAQLETRVRLFAIAGSWLEGAAFLDAGDVSGPRCQTQGVAATACSAAGGALSDRIDLAKLHYAVGGGLRFRTIVGTIRADVGVRLNRLAAMEADGTPNPDPGDRVALHLSIGEPF